MNSNTFLPKKHNNNHPKITKPQKQESLTTSNTINNFQNENIRQSKKFKLRLLLLLKFPFLIFAVLFSFFGFKQCPDGETHFLQEILLFNLIGEILLQFLILLFLNNTSRFVVFFQMIFISFLVTINVAVLAYTFYVIFFKIGSCSDIMVKVLFCIFLLIYNFLCTLYIFSPLYNQS
jgi:hypothetical protein